MGDEGFDVAGVEVGQAGGQPLGVGVAEDAGEVRGEVVQVLAARTLEDSSIRVPKLNTRVRFPSSAPL